nr:hypothetical protein [uncultured Halomonas sp.]
MDYPTTDLTDLISITSAAGLLGVEVYEIEQALKQNTTLYGVALPTPITVGTQKPQILFEVHRVKEAASALLETGFSQVQKSQRERYPKGCVLISRKEELDDDDGEERWTPAGSEWTVNGYEADGSCHIVCEANGAWIVPDLDHLDRYFYPKPE